MNEYLFTARDAQNREIVERVRAPDIEEAKRVLQSRGVAQITFHSDDVFSMPVGDPKKRDRIDREISPRMMLKLRSASPGQALLLTILHGYKKMAIPLVILLAFFVMRRARASEWNFGDWLFIAAWFVPPILAWITSGASRAYHDFQIAGLERRLEDVLRLAPAVERRLKKLGPAGALEGAVHRAKALAGLGRMDEGLAALEPFRHHSAIAPAAFQARLAAVFGSVQMHAEALQCYEEAVPVAPGDPTGWLGLAECLAIRFERAAEARAALERLKSFELGTMSRDGAEYIDGAVRLAEGRYAEAIGPLEAFRQKMVRAAAAIPVAIGAQRVAEALLVCAYAGSGDLPAARQCFDACSELLRLHGDPLVERCERALASAGARLDHASLAEQS